MALVEEQRDLYSEILCDSACNNQLLRDFTLADSAAVFAGRCGPVMLSADLIWTGYTE